MNMSIRENIQQVRENIAAAALSAGRRPEDITLVGASKMNDAAACREAIDRYMVERRQIVLSDNRALFGGGVDILYYSVAHEIGGRAVMRSQPGTE